MYQIAEKCRKLRHGKPGKSRRSGRPGIYKEMVLQRVHSNGGGEMAATYFQLFDSARDIYDFSRHVEIPTAEVLGDVFTVSEFLQRYPKYRSRRKPITDWEVIDLDGCRARYRDHRRLELQIVSRRANDVLCTVHTIANEKPRKGSPKVKVPKKIAAKVFPDDAAVGGRVYATEVFRASRS